MIGRLPIALALALLAGCGGRLTPPDVPDGRRTIDRLARQRAAGQALTPAESRRLSALLDRFDNAPERADPIDAERDDPRGRQARAWRAWARLAADWPGRVASAVIADPRDPGSAALAALLTGATEAERAAQRAALVAARGEMRPAVRCIVDGLWLTGPGSVCAAVGDVQAALDELGRLDPDADPDADRLRWTLAHLGPEPRPAVAAEAAARWIERWPRHADGWAMVGATAAVDVRATPAERLAWAGAAWHRAVSLDARSVRAHLGLADIERQHGLPAAADGHRLDARRAVGADRPLPERWAGAPLGPSLTHGLPALTTAAGLAEAAAASGRPAPSRLLDRAVIVVRPDALPVRETQRLSSTPFAAAPGCVERRHGDATHEQICLGWAIPVDGAVEVPFQTGYSTARAEIVVRSMPGAAPRFESHGGAPGARVEEGPDGVSHVFTLRDVDPVIDGRRRPRVVLRLGDVAGVLPPPTPGMVDRLEAGDRGVDPWVSGDPRRTVARMRAAGLDAEQLWVAVEGRAVEVVARRDGADWRWFTADGASMTVDGPVVAATRADWIGRRLRAIARAAGGDLPSSIETTAPQPGRP